MNTGAQFNADRTHRQRLWRIWDENEPTLTVIGMNPSTADENSNDPTVTRCENRARTNNYGALLMLNVMDVVETHSERLAGMTAAHRCSGANSAVLREVLDQAAALQTDILCAWGVEGGEFGEVGKFKKDARERGVTLFCLGVTNSGEPRHPSRLRNDEPMRWFGGVPSAQAAAPLRSS